MQDRASQIDVLINQLYEQGDFNGAIIISENNELVYSNGFGYADFDKQIPFKKSTTMDAGSLTKTFTALSIHMLKQENLLSLDDFVVDHISSFPYHDIKIKHLINHTSGLVSEDFVFYQSEEGRVLNNDFFLQTLKDSVPVLYYHPGSQFQYNGINYILLAMIIESISGTSFDEFIREKIAQPLGMKDWFLRPARLSDWTKDRTKGYKIISDSLTTSDSEDFEGFYGDCNLFFSAEDLLKWSQSFYLNTLIDKKELDELLQSKESFSSLNALHWYSFESKNQFHFTGHWKGFYTMVYFDIKRKRSIVYLSNTSMDYWLRPQLVTAVLKILNGKYKALNIPDPVYPPVEYRNATYVLESTDTINMKEENERLNITIDSVTYDLYLLDNTFFYVPATDWWIWFTNTSDKDFTIHCTNIYGQRTGKRI